ncbi:MAG: CopD family protein [Bacteroidota bacterium]
MEYVILVGKALHVVGFISWFAGLFFWGRILVYHAEIEERPESEWDILEREYIGMENRVYRGIVNPAMILTWIGGLSMLGSAAYTGTLSRWFVAGTAGWMHVKLLLVFLLVGYQHYTKARIMKPMQEGQRPRSGWQLRLWNEVPTFFLISIAFIAVMGKVGALNWAYLITGIALFGFMIYRGAKAYAKKRAKDALTQEQKESQEKQRKVLSKVDGKY